MSRVIAVMLLLACLLAARPGRTTPPPWSLRLDSTQFPVTVFYETVAQEALAEQTLLLAEQAWHRQIVELNYPTPTTDGDVDPVRVGMSFYLTDTHGPPGSAMAEWIVDVPATPQADCSGRVLTSRTAAGSPSRQWPRTSAGRCPPPGRSRSGRTAAATSTSIRPR